MITDQKPPIAEAPVSGDRLERVRSVGAVILAGGLARRMNGVDKGLVELKSKPMVQWTLEKVTPQVQTVVINANRNLERYREFGVPVIKDVREGHLGPLAGLSAGIPALQTELVFMCPCDSPFFPADMVSRLHHAMHDSSDATIAVARDSERIQPVFLLVNKSCLESLTAFMDAGERKIDRWFEAESVVEVDFSKDRDVFRNINTEEERLLAESLL